MQANARARRMRRQNDPLMESLADRVAVWISKVVFIRLLLGWDDRFPFPKGFQRGCCKKWFDSLMAWLFWAILLYRLRENPLGDHSGAERSLRYDALERGYRSRKKSGRAGRRRRSVGSALCNVLGAPLHIRPQPREPDARRAGSHARIFCLSDRTQDLRERDRKSVV